MRKKTKEELKRAFNILFVKKFAYIPIIIIWIALLHLTSGYYAQIETDTSVIGILIATFGFTYFVTKWIE